MPLDDQGSFEPHVPAAVRRQISQADSIHSQVYATPEPGAPEPVANEAPQAEAPAPAPAPEAPAAPVEPPRTTDWEQLYKTLQGKYNREIGDLRQSQSTMEARIRELAERPPAPPQPEVPDETVRKDREEFGDDLMAAVGRWARNALAPELNELRRTIQRMGEIEGRVQVAQVTTKQSSVENYLSRDPDIGASWSQINNDPRFLAWLDETDPFSGQQRLGMLQAAYADGDGQRTAAFFRAFQREQTVTTQPPASAAAHTSTTVVGAGRPTLEELAAPGRASGQPAGHGAQETRRIYTRDDIRRFYDQKRRGQWATRANEAMAIEADISRATAEGRVRDN